MSLHFNWSRLEETCAEALRQLINKRLAEVVECINSRNAAQTSNGAAGSASAAAKTRATTPTTVPGGAGLAASSSAGAYGGGGGSAAGAGKSEYSLNASSNGSPQEMVAGFTAIPASAAAGAATSRWESMSDPSASSTLASVATLHPSGTQAPHSSAGLSAVGAAAPASAAEMPPPGSAGGSVGGSGGSGVGPGVSISGSAISTASPLHNSGYHGAGATVLAADMHNGNNGGGPSESASFAGEPSAAPAAAVYRTPVGSSWPCFGSASSTAAASSPSPDAAESASKVPPIVYLEVGRVGWGTTPPFVEIVAFENAIDGPPGRTRQHLHRQQQGRGLFGGGREGQGTTGPETRGTFPYTVSHYMSTETLMTTSTAAVEPGVGFAAAADNISECSHGFPSRAHTGAKTPHPVTGSNRLFDGASTGGGGGAGSADMSLHQQPSSSSPSQFPSQPEPVDSLTSVLGPGGLYVRFHITYGGAMHLSLNIAVQHEIRLGAVALRVSLPMMFCIANLDLDCYICVNMKHNMCEVWLEPGPLSPSVVNRLSITAIVGGDDDDGGSSTDFYSHFGSSSISDGDGVEEGSGVYVNEHEVSQFVLHELRSILRETLVAPHSVRIPVSFGGS
ncbi:hypothetical protein conserved [Leishmania donovani]|nr:hypothetical_protein_-_conserved [Leishmania infantum]CAJ1990327.1 hypothetical protein conserved [Leishmania donovani]SUZ43347.1 hypothetical_protein_-_conserved [Leishmania infantum]VDZ46184.1 hypothetical_protein_conserved [Leishmania donovani]